MLLFDALVACLVLKFWSTDAVVALGVTCMIAFLRLMPKLTYILKLFEEGMMNLVVENEENNKEEN